MDPLFSPYGQASTRPSPAGRMMAEFAADFRDGIDINLGVGYVNERTIPAPALVDALGAVVADPARHRQPFNYGGPAGSAGLIEALRGFLARSGEGLDAATISRRRIVVGACGATSLLDAMADVLAPGIVLTSDPIYYIYCEALERKGHEVVAVPEDDEGIELGALERRIAELGERAAEIAFIYIVTVNNPACTVLSNARRRDLTRIAADLSRRLGRAVPIVFDQAYQWLRHDPSLAPFHSTMPEDDLGIVYEIGTLSKVLAPALRIGYLVGPPGALMNALVQRMSDIGLSGPTFAQEMAARMLESDIDAQLAAVNAGYRARALAVGEAIRRALGPWLASCSGGRAGFYYYLTLRGIETGEDSRFFKILTRTTGDEAIDREAGGRGERRPRVVYIPGEICVHPRGECVAAGRHQLRLSYGYEEPKRIAEALGLMREAARAVAEA